MSAEEGIEENNPFPAKLLRPSYKNSGIFVTFQVARSYPSHRQPPPGPPPKTGGEERR